MLSHIGHDTPCMIEGIPNIATVRQRHGRDVKHAGLPGVVSPAGRGTAAISLADPASTAWRHTQDE